MNRHSACPQRDGDRLARRVSGVEGASSILSIQVNDLPCGLLGVLTAHDASNSRPA